ncbi:conserved membrane protein of unknown function [Tenacibaculum sp. 190524A02b]|uniref:hypothetical protein n=1 Tax=Tenacibaculum vairaonense TaxID=3137860 RepID=UPI0032B106D5
MNYLKIIFNFYINSSIHVALAVCSLLRVTELYFELPYNKILNNVVFYGTITGYNFVKYAGVAKLHHKSLTKNLKVIQIFSLICFLLLCNYLWRLPVDIILFFVPFGVLTLLYAIPVFKRFQKSLRNISYLKIIVVAFVWAGVTVLLPIYEEVEMFSQFKVFGVFFQRFLLVIVLILPFDIRDMKFDAISLQTIPKKIGVFKTKLLGVFLVVICFTLELFITKTYYQRLSLFFTLLVFTFLLLQSKEDQSRYYSSFLVESVPIIWWGLLVVIT